MILKISTSQHTIAQGALKVDGNAKVVSVRGCVFSANRATESAGAVRLSTGAVTIEDSSIYGNVAATAGGLFVKGDAKVSATLRRTKVVTFFIFLRLR